MEYEYSYNVSNIEEYINYCKVNGYKLKKKIRQIRTIYRNNNLTARITKEIYSKKSKYILDFKEDKLTDEDLIIRKESKKIFFDTEPIVRIS